MNPEIESIINGPNSIIPSGLRELNMLRLLILL